MYYYYRGHDSSTNTEELTHISISPNPISSNNILSILTKEKRDFKYSIFTSNGVMVISGSTENKSQNIDVSRLSEGIYILKITSDNKVTNLKFIK
ncbi:MAG: T9SS type A sorting domain-containing protein [Flavobacteriaceae bacterium]|nr:T9SS type A sorting domain-containing protein [Flavobacteriaceae bacterium]